MNRFNERYTDLIYHLFREDSWCSLADLSEKTNYSKSTIWRLLSFMEVDLPSGWRIEKNEVKGVRLIKPKDGTLESVWAYLQENNSYIQILGLIVLKNGVMVPEIMEEVHVSRATVYRQIEKIKEVVESNGITLTNSPFKLEGDEKKIRRFIMQYLDFTGRTLDPSYVETFEIDDFKTILYQATTEFSMALHMGALHRLATIIDISNLRISYGYYVTFPEYLLDQYQESEFFEVTKKMFRFMKKCPTREIQLYEMLFFTLYLMNEKMPTSRSKDVHYIRSRIRMKSDVRSRALYQFFHQLSDYVGFDISQDDTFLYKIVQTYRRIFVDSQLKTDTRINNMLSFVPYFETNPLFKEIEHISANLLVEQGYDMAPLEKVEILEIFLLVQAALLRKKNDTSIVTALICRTYVEADFIREVLSNEFGNHLSITVLDYTDLEILKKDNEFDLVISAIGQEVHLHYLPILKISSFPTSAELTEIRHFIDRYFLERLNIDTDSLYPFNH